MLPDIMCWLLLQHHPGTIELLWGPKGLLESTVVDVMSGCDILCY